MERIKTLQKFFLSSFCRSSSAPLALKRCPRHLRPADQVNTTKNNGVSCGPPARLGRWVAKIWSLDICVPIQWGKKREDSLKSPDPALGIPCKAAWPLDSDPMVKLWRLANGHQQISSSMSWSTNKIATSHSVLHSFQQLTSRAGKFARQLCNTSRKTEFPCAVAGRRLRARGLAWRNSACMIWC